jgi:hypothetical protein
MYGDALHLAQKHFQRVAADKAPFGNDPPIRHGEFGGEDENQGLDSCPYPVGDEKSRGAAGGEKEERDGIIGLSLGLNLLSGAKSREGQEDADENREGGREEHDWMNMRSEEDSFVGHQATFYVSH